jgi:tRNA pseudouridine38-40 synthase
MRYFLHLSYKGTNYCGWQMQKNSPSVQQVINEALEKLLGHHIASMGCGRTDTGVHAKDFYMHFNTENELADKANTRFDATERTYEYYVYFDKSSFIKPYSFYQGFYHIDWEKVIEAAAFVKTIEDFTSLCLPSIDFKTNLCYIKESKWEILPSQHLILKPFDEPGPSKPLIMPYNPEKGEVLRFTITSNRFLRGMVRKIVGTILMIGKGKIELEEFKQIVTEKKDFRIHYLAPPNGLFLSKVKYPYFE